MTTATAPFDGSGLYFKHVAAATLITGLYLHVTRLFLGNELTVEHVVTPTFDKIFLIPMAYAAIAGWLVWRRVVHPSRAHKVIFRIIVIYLTISLPFHIQTYFTNSTDLLLAFPIWYSAVFCVFASAMLVFIWRLDIPRRAS